MAPEKVLDALRAADWEEIYPKLMAYAEARSRRLPLVRGGGQLPQGREPQDVVQEAMRLVFEGTRAWNPEKQDLLPHLKGIVSSLVSNLTTGADHIRRIGGSSLEPLDLDTAEGGEGPDPAAQAASDECVEVLRAIVERETEDEEELATVAMGFEDGLAPAEIAELLSIERKDVYALAQKLRRRLLSAMEGHECWEDHLIMKKRARS